MPELPTRLFSKLCPFQRHFVIHGTIHFFHCSVSPPNKVIHNCFLSIFFSLQSINVHCLLCLLLQMFFFFDFLISVCFFMNRELSQKFSPLKLSTCSAARTRVNATKGVSSVCEPLPPDRPLWFPGSTAPEWLDGRQLLFSSNPLGKIGTPRV